MSGTFCEGDEEVELLAANEKGWGNNDEGGGGGGAVRGGSRERRLQAAPLTMGEGDRRRQ